MLLALDLSEANLHYINFAPLKYKTGWFVFCGPYPNKNKAEEALRQVTSDVEIMKIIRPTKPVIPPRYTQLRYYTLEQDY